MAKDTLNNLIMEWQKKADDFAAMSANPANASNAVLYHESAKIYDQCIASLGALDVESVAPVKVAEAAGIEGGNTNG